jgi:hypothetical protein
MLHDFAYLESSSPSPTCRHMGRCSLSLYLDGCASCEFAHSDLQSSGLVTLATTELFQRAAKSAGRGRNLPSARRNR